MIKRLIVACAVAVAACGQEASEDDRYREAIIGDDKALYELFLTDFPESERYDDVLSRLLEKSWIGTEITREYPDNNYYSGRRYRYGVTMKGVVEGFDGERYQVRVSSADLFQASDVVGVVQGLARYRERIGNVEYWDVDTPGLITSTPANVLEIIGAENDFSPCPNGQMTQRDVRPGLAFCGFTFDDKGDFKLFGQPVLAGRFGGERNLSLSEFVSAEYQDGAFEVFSFGQIGNGTLFNIRHQDWFIGPFFMDRSTGKSVHIPCGSKAMVDFNSFSPDGSKLLLTSIHEDSSYTCLADIDAGWSANRFRELPISIDKYLPAKWSGNTFEVPVKWSRGDTQFSTYIIEGEGFRRR